MPRTDGQRNQLCELCGRRLSKVKNTRANGVGRACHPRCKQRPEEADAAAVIDVAAEARPSKKRRAASDPGEPLNLTRLRVRAPPVDTSPPPPKKARSVIPADVSSLLDQAHARRLASRCGSEWSRCVCCVCFICCARCFERHSRRRYGRTHSCTTVPQRLLARRCSTLQSLQLPSHREEGMEREERLSY